MGNLLFGLVKLVGDLIQKAPHGVLPVQHRPGFLVTLDVVFDLLLELLVDLFVLEDAHEGLVDF